VIPEHLLSEETSRLRGQGLKASDTLTVLQSNYPMVQEQQVPQTKHHISCFTWECFNLRAFHPSRNTREEKKKKNRYINTRLSLCSASVQKYCA